MGYLTIISETGKPHSACLFEYNDRKEWYGFKPKMENMPIFPGYIDTSDRSQYIQKYVKYEISDSTLQTIVEKIKIKYTEAFYVVLAATEFVRRLFGREKKAFDCVDLSVDAARWSGLKVSSKYNFFPGNVVTRLAEANLNYIEFNPKFRQ